MKLLSEITATSDHITPEDVLAEHSQDLDSWFNAQVNTGVFRSRDGVALAYMSYLPERPKSCLVISGGRVESFQKYREIIYTLAQHDIAIFSCDHRGQGLSERLSVHSLHGHVNDFEEYVNDLVDFTQQKVMPEVANYGLSLQLFGHSMGGAIAIMACIREPKLFNALSLTAPMLGIKSSIPPWLAKLAVSLGLIFSEIKGRPTYFFGQGDRRDDTFASNHLTHSELRFERLMQVRIDHPNTALGGITCHWLKAALQAMHFIQYNAELLSVPTLLISAGGDEIVDNAHLAPLLAQGKNIEHVSIAHAKHEILFESDQYRTPAFKRILAFIADH